MNVWKFSSRWSDDGNAGSSILHIFRKYGVVFVYNIKPDGVTSLDIQHKVKENDLIALADGSTIVAVAKVLGNATSINNLMSSNFEQDIIDFCGDDNIIAVKVKLLDLPEKSRFYYGKRGRFHALYNNEKGIVIKYWEEQNKNFSITAKTVTLKHNTQDSKAILLGHNVKYIIPIYQRPYSWNEEQLRKFISDIFISYWGTDKNIIEEPMFIGTMQLSDKKTLDDNGYKYEQEIIDGQQRVTTFIIMLKTLSIKFPDNILIKDIRLDCLSTRVNNGEQQKRFDEMLICDVIPNNSNSNIYIQNMILLSNFIDEHIEDVEAIKFNVDSFVKYMTSNIYFVVIETLAGLSKTLQIFNAINTTGLDLNGSDIFKIRMYEYLKDKKGYGEEAFNKISELYQNIDIKNSENNTHQTNMQQILAIYQQILISKFELPNVLYTFGVDTFFERLFDTLLNINKWEHYTSVLENKVELNLNDIQNIIDMWFEWKNRSHKTLRETCAINFIWDSRYGRHWYIIFTFLYRFRENSTINEKIFDHLYVFLEKISKLYIIYSIIFDKKINDIDSFSHKISKDIMNKQVGFEGLLKKVDEKIKGNINYYGGLTKDTFSRILDGNIFYNAKKKNILCRLSAMLEEDNYNNIDNNRKFLFNESIDIEHIQAYNHEDTTKRGDVWEKWGENINSIGNLMILESSMNRSISNKGFSEKKKEYEKSKYKIVKNLSENKKEWDLNDCLERKKIEIEKIIKYLFE